MKNLKKAFLILCLLVLVAGCKDVKLDNGENAIITFKDGGLSAQDLYTELKSQYGGSVVTSLIDTYLLNKLYETTTDENKYVDQAIKTLRESAKASNVDLETYINAYYGMSDINVLKDYLRLNYKRNLWATDYAKEQVTDRQIDDYYAGYIYGDIEASQILITVDAASDATDEAKKEAEKKALDQANSIIKELKDGKDFAELAKKYSKDQTTASNGGSLGKVNTGDIADEALEALRKLKDGSYTTTAVKSSYGYHILYRVSMDEKPELTDELKDEIRTTIGAEIKEESGFGAKALFALREKYEMKFVDTDLESQYNKANNQ